MIPYLQVLAGLVLLLLGGELLVRSAVALARRFGVSPLFVGLTVVAFGTSAPELVVCLVAVLENAPAIAVGNVVGSNIANILLILGTASLIYPIACPARFLQRDGTMVLGATALFSLLMAGGVFDFRYGLIMLICLFGYLSYSYMRDRRDQQATVEIIREVEEMRTPGQPTVWIAMKLIAGIGGVVLGSDWLVAGGVTVAREWGVPEAVIGLTMFAIGTSLPELATSAVAAWHKHSDLALGNVIGSNIFNMLAVMGVVAVIVPVEVPDQIVRFDLWVMLGVTVGFLALAYTLKHITRPLGILFLVLYVAYVASLYLGVSGMTTGSAM
ncbi:MAG: calcium/sodium antiporter [Alphaproteobacteria bacterium]|nr:calcium/sodium antiporter [Alphaproteobacteria bacterium]